MNGYVYMLTDKRNGKKYIGKHNGNNKNYFTGGKIPNLIAKKHGKEVFDRIILEDNIPTNEELLKKEIGYIEQYDTFNNGYNLSIGGDGGGEWIYLKTEEEKEEIANKKSQSLMGRTFSTETLTKMSVAKKGIPLTEEHKKNISENSAKNFLGKHHTDETKAKISLLKIGVKNPKLSETMKNNSNPKYLQPVSIDGVIYTSILEASQKLGMKRGSIKYRLNSKTKRFKNWFKIDKEDGTMKSHSRLMITNNPNFRQISINGKVYKGITIASKETGMSVRKITMRLNSDAEKYKAWFRIEKSEVKS